MAELHDRVDAVAEIADDPLVRPRRQWSTPKVITADPSIIGAQGSGCNDNIAMLS